MSDTILKKFMVFYLIPLETMNDWKKVDPEFRKSSEEKMKQEWAAWMQKNSSMILSTEVGGKTKSVVANGVTDMRNDIILFSLVQGESHDAVAEAFQKHPHLQIPKASIQVMEVMPMGPMQQI